MSGEYAKGSKAWGICRRCGLRDLLNNLVFDEYYPGLRVHIDCKDYRHPQEKLIVVSDPIALWKPSPEDENTPPVLTGSQNISTINLSWTAAMFFRGIVDGYKVYRSVNGADFVFLATYTNTYSWDGELETETLSTADATFSPGDTLDYYVAAFDINNRTLQSNDLNIVTTLSPPSAPVLSGTNSGTTNQLSWTIPTAGSYPISGYRLYNADTDVLIVDQAASPYDNTGLLAGTYNYYVIAYDTHGNVSPHSNIISLTVMSGYFIVTGFNYIGKATDVSGSITPVYGGFENTYRGAAFSPTLGMIVCVSDSGNRIVTSNDSGSTWISRTYPNAGAWWCVTWSSTLGMFVGGSRSTNTGNMMTSTNGINWTARNGISFYHNDIAYSVTDAILVSCAESSSGTASATTDKSTTGTSWSSSSTSASAVWNGICVRESDGLFVQVGTGDSGGAISVCATSSDGVTWTSRSCVNGTWYGVCYSPELGLFVAVGGNSSLSSDGLIMTSPDGITWTARTPPNNGGNVMIWKSVSWSPSLGVFLAVGSKSSISSAAMKSTDGINWTSVVFSGLAIAGDGNCEHVIWVTG